MAFFSWQLVCRTSHIIVHNVTVYRMLVFKRMLLVLFSGQIAIQTLLNSSAIHFASLALYLIIISCFFIFLMLKRKVYFYNAMGKQMKKMVDEREYEEYLFSLMFLITNIKEDNNIYFFKYVLDKHKSLCKLTACQCALINLEHMQHIDENKIYLEKFFLDQVGMALQKFPQNLTLLNLHLYFKLTVVKNYWFLRELDMSQITQQSEDVQFAIYQFMFQYELYIIDLYNKANDKQTLRFLEVLQTIKDLQEFYSCLHKYFKCNILLLENLEISCNTKQLIQASMKELYRNY